MITWEPRLTTRGDCIVAVAAEMGVGGLDSTMKAAMRSRGAKIKLVLEACGIVFEISGRGDPGLTLTHMNDMVARRSNYICDRTVMVRADKAACDIPPPLLRLLKEPERAVNIELVVETSRIATICDT